MFKFQLSLIVDVENLLTSSSAKQNSIKRILIYTILFWIKKIVVPYFTYLIMLIEIIIYT